MLYSIFTHFNILNSTISKFYPYLPPTFINIFLIGSIAFPICLSKSERYIYNIVIIIM